MPSALGKPETMGTEGKYFPVPCSFAVPISQLGEYFRPLAGCADVSSCIMDRSKQGICSCGGAEVCAAAIHPRGRHKTEPIGSAILL